ncbi:hypothetical protein AHAS_Ahas20G0176000 [Arachis hypogaea]
MKLLYFYCAGLPREKLVDGGRPTERRTPLIEGCVVVMLDGHGDGAHVAVTQGRRSYRHSIWFCFELSRSLGGH